MNPPEIGESGLLIVLPFKVIINLLEYLTYTSMQPQQQHQHAQQQQCALHPAPIDATLAPQWLKPPQYESALLKDLVANHFPAIVPTHLYSAEDYHRDI